jgi:hypothetical protein
MSAGDGGQGSDGRGPGGAPEPARGRDPLPAPLERLAAALAADRALLPRMRPRRRHERIATAALGIAVAVSTLPAIVGAVELVPATWVAQVICLAVVLLDGRTRRGVRCGPALVVEVAPGGRRVTLLLVDGTRVALAARPGLGRRLGAGDAIVAEVARGCLIGARRVPVLRPSPQLQQARLLHR